MNRTKCRNLLIALPLAATLGILAGCAAVTTSETSTSISVAADVTAAEVLADNEAAFVGETSYDAASATAIDLADTDGDTLTISEAGTYVLSGNLAGQVVVDAEGADVTLVLDGVDITSSTTAAIAATAVENFSVILADGSSNSLSDAASYADDADVNAALYSAGDLQISGSGTLEVTGNGNDGITSKDGLTISGGEITVDAVDDGIRGKDSLVVTGGTLDVTAGGDGLKSDNEDETDRGYIAISDGTLAVTSGGDALSAQTDLVITGGTLDLAAGGGSTASLADGDSAKALKGLTYVVVEGGTVTADAADDAVHSNGAVHLARGTLSLASGDDAVHADTALLIDGGTVDVTASFEGLESAVITVAGGEVSVVASDDGVNGSDGSGESMGSVAGVSVTISGGTLDVDAQGDGLDSNGDLTITGGTTTVNGPTDNGNGALDANGTFTVSGGVLAAAGSSGMAVSPSADSAQTSVSATFDTLPAGTVVTIVDSDGASVGSFEASKEFSSLVFSSADIQSGSDYDFTVDGAVVATATGGEALAGGMGGGMGGPGAGQGGNPGDR
jgi:hypothetical protein